MSCIKLAKTYIYSKLLCAYYSCLVLFGFFVNFLKNPFADPWAQKLRLEPPSCLTDPKYGTHKYMIFNNTKLHYVESGDPNKALMIFLHGFPEFWYSWRYQIAEFNKHYWCIAVDMRGYGDSEKPEEMAAYKMNVLVDDVRDIVRQLGREKCILIGHDWGSLVAAKFRDTYPEALLAIILLGGASFESWFKELWSNPVQFKMSWYVFMFHMPSVPEKFILMNDLKLFNQMMIVKGKDSVTEQDLECYKYWFGKPLALTPPLNYYRANFAYDVTDKPRCELKVPFMIINGAKDIYLNPGILDRLKEMYSHIETLVLENCGHFVQQEEPNKVNTHIKNFLNKNNL